MIRNALSIRFWFATPYRLECENIRSSKKSLSHDRDDFADHMCVCAQNLYTLLVDFECIFELFCIFAILISLALPVCVSNAILIDRRQLYEIIRKTCVDIVSLQSQLHCIALSCIELHWIALSCIELHWVALSCIELHCFALNYITLHWIALRCITLHYVALRCITLHCVALRCIALYCIALSKYG